jgi:opacity protein-like surface antigen
MVPIIHPYARGIWAFMDKVEDENKKFKTYGGGLGVEFSFLPFISLFGEYMYEKSKHELGDISSNAVNFGLKADF